MRIPSSFFFNDTATTEIYTLSLHDALPIFRDSMRRVTQTIDAVLRTNRFSYDSRGLLTNATRPLIGSASYQRNNLGRSEEHTSELQSQSNLVCRLLLEKKRTHITHVAAHCC